MFYLRNIGRKKVKGKHFLNTAVQCVIVKYKGVSDTLFEGNFFCAQTTPVYSSVLTYIQT